MYKLSVLLMTVGACSFAQESEEKMYLMGHEYDQTPLGNAVDRASFRLLKEAFKAAKNDTNVVASPLGVLMLLSMYSAGAGKGEGIKEEIVKALGYSNYDEVYKSYVNLSDRLSSMDPDHLTLANKLYIDQKYEVANEFSNGPIRSYHSEVGKVKFSDPPSAVEAINRWSDEKTKGHIKNPVSVDSISPLTAAALVNVIFFQGQWNVPFNASETEEKDFHVDKSKTVKKPMMRLEQPLFYHNSPELGAQMIELPYKEKHFRMVVVLPDEIDGLPALLEKVEKKGLLTDVFSMRPINVDIQLEMPKFEIISELNLNDLLPKVGVSKIFSEGATEIVRGDSVVVDQAFQKAFVKVDEEGATAGAFTGFIMVPMSSSWQPPQPLVIKVDHPFLFAILHEDMLLFAGTYTH